MKKPGVLDASVVDWLANLDMLRNESPDSKLSDVDLKRLRSGTLTAKVTTAVFGCDLSENKLCNDSLDNWKLIVQSLGEFSSLTLAAKDGVAVELAKGNDNVMNSLMKQIMELHQRIQKQHEISPITVAVSVTKGDLKRGTCLEESNTIGQLLVQSVCSDLLIGLNPEHAAALLDGTNTNYLNQLVAEGPKRDFSVVLNWVKKLHELRDVFGELLVRSTHDEDIIGFLHLWGLLLCSTHTGVCTMATEILEDVCSRFCYGVAQNEIPSTHFDQLFWTWIRTSSGASMFLNSWSQESRPAWLNILFSCSSMDSSKRQMSEFLCIDLLSAQINVVRYMELMHELVMDNEGHPVIIEFTKNAIPPRLVTHAMCYSESHMSTLCRQTAIGLLSQLWVSFPTDLEASAEIPKAILVAINKGIRETDDLSLRLFSVAVLFHLMEKFADQHRTYAPHVYKTIIFALIEFHALEPMRDFIVANLSAALTSLPFAPVGVLVVPLVKQISLHGFTNLDLDFMKLLSHHQTLDVKDAMRLMDMCAKVALNDTIFSRAATEPLLCLIKRFSLNKSVVRFLSKVAQSAVYLLDETKDQIHRAIVLDVITQIVGLKITPLNQVIKPILQTSCEVSKSIATENEKRIQTENEMMENSHQEWLLPKKNETSFDDTLRGSMNSNDDDDDLFEAVAQVAAGSPQVDISRSVNLKAKSASPKNRGGFQENASQEMANLVKLALKKTTQRFTGLTKAFNMLDMADTGYIEKIKLIQMLQNKKPNAVKSSILECQLSKPIMERKNTEKIRVFGSKKPGEIQLVDLEQILKEYYRKRQPAVIKQGNQGKINGELCRRSTMLLKINLENIDKAPEGADIKVRQAIDDIERRNKEKAEKERQDNESRKVVEAQRRAKLRLKFEKKREQRKEISNQSVELDISFAEELSVFKRFQKVLKVLFSNAIQGGNAAVSFQRMRKVYGSLSLANWLRFLYSLQMIPRLLTKDDARGAFLRSRKQPTSDASFDDFLAALAYAAATSSYLAFEPTAEARVLALMSLLREAAIGAIIKNNKLESETFESSRMLRIWMQLEKVIPEYKTAAIECGTDHNESLACCLNILDDIVSKNFNFHILVQGPGPTSTATKVKQLLNAVSPSVQKPPLVPIDTRLYPKEKIERIQSKLPAPSKHKQGFGSTIVVDDPVAHTAAEVSLTAAEISFLGRLKTSTPQEKLEDRRRKEEESFTAKNEAKTKKRQVRQQELKALLEEQKKEKESREQEDLRHKQQEEQIEKEKSELLKAEEQKRRTAIRNELEKHKEKKKLETPETINVSNEAATVNVLNEAATRNISNKTATRNISDAVVTANDLNEAATANVLNEATTTNVSIVAKIKERDPEEMAKRKYEREKNGALTRKKNEISIERQKVLLQTKLETVEKRLEKKAQIEAEKLLKKKKEIENKRKLVEDRTAQEEKAREKKRAQIESERLQRIENLKLAESKRKEMEKIRQEEVNTRKQMVHEEVQKFELEAKEEIQQLKTNAL